MLAWVLFQYLAVGEVGRCEPESEGPVRAVVVTYVGDREEASKTKRCKDRKAFASKARGAGGRPHQQSG